MSLISPRGNMRWKEWIPLMTQQQRLRNLIQVIAYNINQDISLEEKRKKGKRYYYTLHLTTMSSPFYTSEKLDSENPKWSELELTNPVHGTATGVVIRVWQNYNNEDTEVTVWGVCFSGLVYIGPQLSRTNPAVFSANTIVFYMHGGYFTDPQCFKGKSSLVVRLMSTSLPSKEVKLSYPVSLMSKIHEVQQEIKKQTEVAENLRQQILMGGTQLPGSEVREASSTLRKLLNQSKPPKPQHHEILAVKKEIELVKFRVQLLSQEKSRKSAELRRLTDKKDALFDTNQNKGCELMEKYRELKRNIEYSKQSYQQCIEAQESLSQASSQLSFRRKRLISELSYIYPITEISEGKYAICGIHLPNSEEFNGHDEVQITAALGYVAHLVQMIAYFLHVPPRYPIIHYGSRSKIIDHVNANMPDKDRQFPLFSRGKDKLQFNYGVYLLNKNIAQLRWYCGIPTNDLRTTLPNLASLLQVKLSSYVPTFDLLKRSFSRPATEISSSVSPHRQVSPQFCLNTSTALSYSLDKGLDRWTDSKKLSSEESCVSSSFQSSSYEDSLRNTVPQMFLQWQGSQVACLDDETKQPSSLPVMRDGVNVQSNLDSNFTSMSSIYHSLPAASEGNAPENSSVNNRVSNSSLPVNYRDIPLDRASIVDEAFMSSIRSTESEDAVKSVNFTEHLAEALKNFTDDCQISISMASESTERVNSHNSVMSEDTSVQVIETASEPQENMNCDTLSNDLDTHLDKDSELKVEDSPAQDDSTPSNPQTNHQST